VELAFVSAQKPDLLFLLLDHRFELEDAAFEDLLLGLDVPGFLCFVFYDLFQLALEFLLIKFGSFVASGLHLTHYPLIHFDHLLERSLNSVSLPLQVVHLVTKGLIFCLQGSVLTGLFLKLLQKVGIFEQNVVC